jgi:hypothetical protein
VPSSAMRRPEGVADVITGDRIHLLGTRYGRNALLPGDPRPWTDYNGQYVMTSCSL